MMMRIGTVVFGLLVASASWAAVVVTAETTDLTRKNVRFQRAFPGNVTRRLDGVR